GLVTTAAVSVGWLLNVDASVGQARATVAGLLLALAVGSAAGLSGLRGALARRAIAAVAVGGFGMQGWAPGAALLEVDALGMTAIPSMAAMLLGAAGLGIAMRRSRPARG